jgi:hypothetical protein
MILFPFPFELIANSDYNNLIKPRFQGFPNIVNSITLSGLNLDSNALPTLSTAISPELPPASLYSYETL